ncbi:DUF4062 domain-containing protein [Chloroflexota bacterium]
MSYIAKVFNVMIASPNDVASERRIIREVVDVWNTVNSMLMNTVLLPIGWETHTTPEMGKRPQEIINKQILYKCDLLVGVFWTRLGTASGGYISGTVEEIEKHIKSAKPAMLYFSNKQPVNPENADSEQIENLKKFKESCYKRGLCETYDNLSNFRKKFYRQLQLIINQHEYFNIIKEDLSTDSDSPSELIIRQLSTKAKRMLKEASSNITGLIMIYEDLDKTSYKTGAITLCSSIKISEILDWRYALYELRDNNLIVQKDDRGKQFKLTNLGYDVARFIYIDELPPLANG